MLARWSLSSAAEPGAAGTIRYESLDGRQALWLRAPADESPDDRTDGWVPFRYGHGFPHGAPDAPDAPYLLVVRAVAPDERDRDDFRRWLGEEHGPRQTTLDGVRWLQAYEQEGSDHSFLNLWGVDNPTVVDSEAWVQVRRSPWWDRVAHVAAAAERGVYRRRGDPGSA